MRRSAPSSGPTPLAAPVAAEYLSSPTPGAISRWASHNAGSGHTVVALFGDREADCFSGTADLGRTCSAHLVAALFPGVITGGNRHRSGALLLALPSGAPPSILDLADSPHAERPIQGGTTPVPENRRAAGRPAVNGRASAGRPAHGARTLLALVDGLTPRVDSLLDALRTRVAPGGTVLGGGAGTRDLRRGACLMARGRLWRNAAVLISLGHRAHLGVQHGWTRTAGPLVATATEGNVLHRLNWEPAADVYRRLLKRRGLSGDALSDAGARYPLGMMRQGDEDVIRIPLDVRDDGSIVCGGPVPRHSVLHLLQGDARVLRDAAETACTSAFRAGEREPRGWFVAECMCREAILGRETGVDVDTYSRAVSADTSDAGRPSPQGVMTIGQIATTRNGTVEWFNGSTVVGALREADAS